jgi:hypothetical protein
MARSRTRRRIRPGTAIVRRTYHGRVRERGQSLVLVALWMTALLGLAAVAIDVGRFYAERRFLQNAADAAALAGAQALIAGKTATQAEATARDVLAQNFARDPTGRTPSLPSAVPVYEAGYAGQPAYLRDGILVGAPDVRVAVNNTVDYTFGRAVGLTNQRISAQARAAWARGLLPIAARRYVKAPGPSGYTTCPNPNDETRFMDFFATAATACLGTETDRTARIDPSSGAPFNPSNPGDDPVNHGPIMAILGQSAQPSNASMFRGLVALDIRNYASMGTREYYNGIAPGTVPESIRASQADYIRKGGYPGPDMPTPTDPPAPENQVGVMSGSAAGQTIAELDQTYNPGDEILAMVYPGYVQEVPQFTMTAPTQVSLPTTGSQTAPVPFKVARNQAFAGTVTLCAELEGRARAGTTAGGEALLDAIERALQQLQVVLERAASRE